jgi:hypothetical protein
MKTISPKSPSVNSDGPSKMRLRLFAPEQQLGTACPQKQPRPVEVGIGGRSVAPDPPLKAKGSTASPSPRTQTASENDHWVVRVPASRLSITALGLGKGRARNKRTAQELSDVHLLILMRLESFARLDPHCWPSNPTLAKLSGFKVDYLRNLLEDLESAGAISLVYTNGNKRCRDGILMHRRFDPDLPTVDLSDPPAMKAAVDALRHERYGRKSGAGSTPRVEQAPHARVEQAPPELRRNRTEESATEDSAENPGINLAQTITIQTPEPTPQPASEATPDEPQAMAEEPEKSEPPTIPISAPIPEPDQFTPGQREFLAKLDAEDLCAAFDARPEKDRAKWLDWFRLGCDAREWKDSAFWKDVTSKLRPIAVRPIPSIDDPLPKLFEALQAGDPEVVSPLAARMAWGFSDQHSTVFYESAIEEVRTGAFSYEAFEKLCRTTLNPSIAKKGAYFAHSWKQFKDTHRPLCGLDTR